MTETCIQRYKSKISGNEYLIIIHPLPNDFARLTSDLDIFYVDNSKESHTIESYLHEKYSNEMIIKFVKYSYNDEVNYEVNKCLFRIHVLSKIL